MKILGISQLSLKKEKNKTLDQKRMKKEAEIFIDRYGLVLKKLSNE
jgi:hypothetical protein